VHHTTMSGETNKHRYVIATQSHPLRVTLRAIPGVPIVHVNRSVMVLGPASDVTLQFKQRVRYLTGSISTFSADFYSPMPPLSGRAGSTRAVHVRKGHAQCSYTSGRTCRKRKKGPKGPNPLSVKKKAPPKHAVQETKKTRVAATPKVEEVEIANREATGSG